MQHCCGCFLLHSLAASGLIAEPQKPQGCQPSRVGSLTDKRDEWTYKPNSVSRESPHGRRPSIWDGDCSTPQATYPECGRAAPAAQGRPPHAWSCSRCGIPSRPSYLSRWWSLTPPFHSCPQPKAAGDLLSVALFSRVTPPGRYPASCSVEFGLSSKRMMRSAVARSTHLWHDSMIGNRRQPYSLHNVASASLRRPSHADRVSLVLTDAV